MSLSGSDYSGNQDALKYALDHDVLVVMASADVVNSFPLSPANYAQLLPNYIAVGATQCDLSGMQSFAAFTNQAGSMATY